MTPKEKKAKILDILCQTFVDNKSVNYVIKQDNNKLRRLRKLMDYCFEMAELFGETYLSNDHKVAMIIMYPHKRRTNFKTIWLDMKLAFGSIGLFNIKKVLHREKLLKLYQPQPPFVYLWYIGVSSIHQGQGKGSKALIDLINKSKEQQLPLFLETSTERNFKFYEKLGFKLYREVHDFGFPMRMYLQK